LSADFIYNSAHLLLKPFLAFVGHVDHDLCVLQREKEKSKLKRIQRILLAIPTIFFSCFCASIQCFQLQSSRHKYHDMSVRFWFTQNRSQHIFFRQHLGAHIVTQFLSLALFSIFAMDLLPPPTIALTGSPALRNFLFGTAIGGPGLWLLSQVLLLVYYKLDNGSNVCGLEFNFARRNTSANGAQNSVRSDIGDDVSYEKQIFQQFSHGFGVESEEGSWVDPEFTDEEVTTSSNTETGGSFEEKVEEVENKGIVDNKIFIRIAKMGGLQPVR